MFLKRHSIIAALFLIVLFSGGSFADDNFDDLVIFGDSLSDTGNLASLQGGFPPPFFDNRVSNGPIMVDILTKLLGLGLEATPSLHLTGDPPEGSNYAVAGGKAAGMEPDEKFIDLSAQVNAFLASTGGVASYTSLYLIAIGGNDVRSARDTPSFRSAIAVLRAAADSIAENIRTLIQAGAINFLVVNSPDIGQIPETRLIADQLGDSRFAKQATIKSYWFNYLLKQRLGAIKKNYDVRLTEFEAIPFATDITRNASGLDLVNTDDNCFSTQNSVFTPACEEIGRNFDQFFYFDEIHPTSVVHQRIGRALFAVVPVAE